MFYTHINYLAVCISAIISAGIGLLWYSPRFFKKPWLKYSKHDTKKLKKSHIQLSRTYGIFFLAAFLTAYVLALLINITLITNIEEGILLGSIVWIGFIATTMGAGVLFQEVPWELFLIHSGYQLTSILIMSVILTVWI